MANQKTRLLFIGYWVSVILMAVVGTGIVLYCTVWGAALSDDSYYYIHAARDLIAGNGFTMTAHFPPALPLILSMIGFLGKIDPLDGIRWLNACLFGVNIVLTGMLVHHITRSRLFAWVAAGLFLLADTTIMLHAWAMSEALYVTFMLGGFLAGLQIYPQRRWLGILGLACGFGLAAATRYIGVSLLVAGGLFLFFEAGRNWKTRLQNALAFGLVGILPLLGWAARNYLVIGRPTSRVMAWHPIPPSLWIKALNTMFLWVAPGRLVHDKELIWLAAALFLLLVASRFWQWRDSRIFWSGLQRVYQNRVTLLVGFSLLSYWVILVVSRTVFDSAIPMDQRLLSPVFVMVLIAGCAFAAQAWNFQKSWARRGMIGGILLALVVVNITRSLTMVQSYHELGRGYASARDHISETYAYLRNRPNVSVYSNAFASIYFWVGRDTFSLPPRAEISTMKDDMRQNSALLVVFNSIPLDLYGLSEAELIDGLEVEITLSEATIYRYPRVEK
jgi:hypothetical protein